MKEVGVIMKADIIIKSNAIFTGLEKEPFKGSIGITGKNITYVGKNDIPSSWIEKNTKIFNFDNQLVTAGLSDTHLHYLMLAAILSDYCCSELSEAKSEKECIEILKKFSERNPGAKKLMGFGWFPANWTEGPNPHALPSKVSLDEAFPHIPVYLMMADGHTFWCNTKALEECKIHKNMKYSFGYLGLDENGELNGILSELELIAPCFNQFYDFPDNIAEEMQEKLLKDVAKMGITSITDVAECTVINEVPAEIKKIKSMEAKGKLTARVNIYPSLGITTDMSIQTEIRDLYSSGMVKISGLKQFFDGVTSTYTAALIEPYEDKPDVKGDLNYDKEIFRQSILAANKAGFGVKIHCIGDYAVRAGLDIFEDSKNITPTYKQCRNSIEHIETIAPSDIPRFKQLGVTASVQPVHLPLDANEKIERVGEERSKFEWPLKSFVDCGVNLAFGTDAPVSSLNPFENMYFALTRKDIDGNDTGVNPEEKITLQQAIMAYTYGSAYANNREDELGTLEIGKLADITVISKNLFEIPVEDIKKCKAVMTIVDGKVVYDESSPDE